MGAVSLRVIATFASRCSGVRRRGTAASAAAMAVASGLEVPVPASGAGSKVSLVSALAGRQIRLKQHRMRSKPKRRGGRYPRG